MALAVWEISEPEEPEGFETSEPLRLRLLPDPEPTRSGAGRCRDHVESPRSWEEEWGRLPSVHSLTRPEPRRACVPGPRTSVRVRRLRVAAVLFALTLVVLLALPVRAWAGTASGPAPTRPGSTPGHVTVHPPVERILLPG